MSSDSESSHSTMPLRGSDSGAFTDSKAKTSSLQQLTRWIKHAMNYKPENTLKEALEEVLEEHEDAEGGALVSDEERTMLRNMIAFGEVKVGDVMVPRTDIMAVQDSIDKEEMQRFLTEHRHTRVPVYSESLDQITGFVHMKDFFHSIISDGDFDLNELKRDILFVPPSMKIVDLMLKMRLASCHMAIVIDEYGGTDGLVTMEDLFEEIVGEIQDEHDDDEVLPEMHWVNERTLEADARIEIEDLSKELRRELVEDIAQEDFETLGGWVFSKMGRIPAKGEVLDLDEGIHCEILSADPRRIKRVRISVSEAAAALEDV